MALAAVKTFVAAEILYAADLNALNTNILNNPMSLISPWTANLDADGFDLGDLGELEFRDESANPTASGRLRRNGSQLIWAIEDARTATTVRPFVVQATTSGAPSVSIGTGVEFRGESGDENPSVFGALDFIATDVAAGSEDTGLEIMLRIGGATIVAAYRFVANATSARAVFTHANAADRTYTLPDATMTVVGHDTTQTLTSKTVNLASNTLTGTTAQFNTALSDAEFATLAGTETLTNKTLTSPTVNGATLGGTTSVAASGVIVPAAVSGTPAQHALFRENVVKGWISFDMTPAGGTINDSFNVTSITDNGVGDYTITWDRDFANATYAVAGMAQAVGAAGNQQLFVGLHTTTPLAAGTTRVTVSDSAALQDSAMVTVIAVGDQ